MPTIFLCFVAGSKTSPRPPKMGLFDKIAEKLDSKTPHDHGGTSEAHLQPGCLCFDVRAAVFVSCVSLLRI